MTELYETPYGRKTGKLLTDSMDVHTMFANDPKYGAAPDLLAALQMIETDKDGDGFICREAMEMVRYAIAKAEGR